MVGGPGKISNPRLLDPDSEQLSPRAGKVVWIFFRPSALRNAGTATPAPRLQCPWTLDQPQMGGNKPRLRSWNQHSGFNAHPNTQSQASTCTAACGTSSDSVSSPPSPHSLAAPVLQFDTAGSDSNPIDRSSMSKRAPFPVSGVPPWYKVSFLPIACRSHWCHT